MVCVIQSEQKQDDGTAILTGVFAGPVTGLKYQTPTITGLTNEHGEFSYRSGEAVTFLIGQLALGTTNGKPQVNLAQLVHRVSGNIDKLHDPAVTNLARLVQTLDQDGNVENGVQIAPAVHDIFGSRVITFDSLPGIHADATPGLDGFENNRVVVDVLSQLNATSGVFTARTPRTLATGPAARNELRRNIRGIIKMTDVEIPLRDGSYVCADVFRPADSGQHPVIMNMSFYGKSI